MNSLPRLKNGLLSHHLDDQILVYNPSSESVHLLDQATGSVLELLEEGGWTREGIIFEVAQRIGKEYNSDSLSLALDTLKELDLFENNSDQHDVRGVDRREAIRRVAVTGAVLLIPVVATLTASPGYAQGTGANIANGSPCVGTNGGSCASGICVTNTATPTCCGNATKTGKGGTCTGGGGCCSGTCTGGFCA
jgi:hypothetical protein